MEIGKILDIGISSGGEYIRSDPQFVKRIGIDNNALGLLMAQQVYGIRPIVADANFLPFRDSLFDQIDIIFPEDLVRDLTSPKNTIWPELARVLRPEGIVKVIVDEQKLWSHGVNASFSRGGIFLPTSIVNQAEEANFEVKWRTLRKDEYGRMGTGTTQLITLSEAHGIRISIYEVRAVNHK